MHGVQTIPAEIANQVADATQEILRVRENLIGVCHSADFSLERLRTAVGQVDTWFEQRTDKKTE
jgi:hypothetical protein